MQTVRAFFIALITVAVSVAVVDDANAGQVDLYLEQRRKDRSGDFVPGIRKGFQQSVAAGQSLVGNIAAGLGFEQFGIEQAIAGHRRAQAAGLIGENTPQRIEDIEGVGDFVDYAQGLLGRIVAWLILLGSVPFIIVASCAAFKWHGKVVEWYGKVVEQGDAGAQNQLAWKYHEGDGVPQDYAEAIRWFRRASKQGVAEAQYMLGKIYGAGKGVPKNDYESYIWLSIAVARGYEKAKDLCNVAEKELSPTERSAAQKEATRRFNKIQRKSVAKQEQ